MDEKIKKNKFLNTIISAGLWISNFFILQLLWILYTLKGLVFLGLFPATASVVQVMYRWFEEKEAAFSINDVFRETYKNHFKQANQTGYIYLIVLAVLYIDLRVSNVFIQSIFLHTMLLILTFMVACVGLYFFTVMIRYEFSLKNILKQSFFVSLSVPLYTLSAGIGLIIAVELIRNYMFLLMFFGIPILFLPIVWFTYTGIEKAEERRREDTKE